MAQKFSARLPESPLYRVRLVSGREDLAPALALRARLFRGAGAGAEGAGAEDADGFDPLCRHLVVETKAGGAPVCTCRLLDIPGTRPVGASYAAQFYDLSPLEGLKVSKGLTGPMLELGRFCIAPEARGADVLRLVWGALTRIVVAEGVGFLFGCTSFPGTDAAPYRDAFALLQARHLAPESWRPRVRASEVVCFATGPKTGPGRPGPGPESEPEPALKPAQHPMPPLLQSYLAMGGRVSDHAVRDADLNTLHVFTGLDIARVPAPRRRALMALSGG